MAIEKNLEKSTFNRIRLASDISFHRFGEPLTVAYSGGKDSDLLIELTRRSGVPFIVEHNHTTADAPETIYHVRKVFAKLEDDGIACRVNKPTYKGVPTTMWKLIAEKGMPPTRLQRYCCDVLKERGGQNALVMTGVRWSESNKRKASRGVFEHFSPKKQDKLILTNDNDETREIMETCKIRGKLVANPIVDWEDYEVWDYILSEKILMNPLYECGFHRVGCVGCPMAGKKRWFEFARYPTFQHAYMRAFEKMLAIRLIRRPEAYTRWKTPDDVFRWWMEDKNLDGQIGFDDLPELQEAEDGEETE